jgi:uncharacterized protein
MLSKIFVLFVRAYQVTLSPLFGDCCRFTPSCSEYMIEAIQIHGALKGGWLGLKRIMRCHPFGGKGYDPVPGREVE